MKLKIYGPKKKTPDGHPLPPDFPNGYFSALGLATPEEIASLKPCPFCGSEDLEVSNDTHDCAQYLARCKQCGGNVEGEFGGGGFATRAALRQEHRAAFASACDRWNTRVPDQG